MIPTKKTLEKFAKESLETFANESLEYETSNIPGEVAETYPWRSYRNISLEKLLK